MDGGNDRRRSLGTAVRNVELRPADGAGSTSSSMVAEHGSTRTVQAPAKTRHPSGGAMRGGGVKRSTHHQSTSSLVSSFALPNAPQSSQVYLSDGRLQLSGAGGRALRPPTKTHGLTSSHNDFTQAPMSELLPTRRGGTGFQSTTYLRDVTLPFDPGFPPTAATLRPIGTRKVNMAKSRYLPASSRIKYGNNFAEEMMTITHLGGGAHERLHTSRQELERTRWLKRSSEYLPHRVPLGYALCGNGKQLHGRYNFTGDEDDSALLQMQPSDRLYYGQGIRGSSKPNKSVEKFKSQPRRPPSPPVPSVPIPQETRPPSVQPAPSTSGGRNSALRGVILSRQGNREDEGNLPDGNPDEGMDVDVEEEDDEAAALPNVHKVLSPQRKKSLLKLSKTGDNRGMSQDISKLVRKESFQEGEDVMAHMESYVSDEHRRRFTKAFNSIDKTGRGRIKIGELKSGMFSDSEDADYVLEVFDLNRDGNIDLEEFITVAALNDRLCRMNRSPSNNADVLVLNLPVLAHHIGKFRALFNLADSSADGRVETDEILVLMAAAFGLPAFDKALAITVLKTIDQDESGFIEFVEFMQYIPFFLKLQKKIVKDPLALDLVETAKKGLARRKTQKKIIKIEKTVDLPMKNWGDDTGL